MEMIKNILTPVGISEVQINSSSLMPNVRFGYELARKFKAKLTLLQTYLLYHGAYPSGGFATTGVAVDPIVDSFEPEEVKNKVEEMIRDEFPQIGDLDYEIVVLPGSDAEVVKDYFEQLDPDLIVAVGNSEATDLETFLGTMSERISRKAFCPTLIVPREADYKPFKKIGIAIDEENLKEGIPTAYLAELVKAFHASLRVVHVMSGSRDEGDRKQDHFYQTLREQLSPAAGNELVVRTIAEGDVKSGVEDFASVHQIDLLAVIYRDHGVFRRLFAPGLRKQLIGETEVPLLVLK